MELLLNLVWLLVASGAIIAWLAQNRLSARANRPKLCLQVIALGCALAVLFPAISATDDLHAAQLAVEASDVARKVLRNMSTASVSGTLDWLHFLPAVLLLAAIAALRGRYVRTVLESRVLLRRAGFFPLLEGRAPPMHVHA
jgi:hypothetical protein